MNQMRGSKFRMGPHDGLVRGHKGFSRETLVVSRTNDAASSWWLDPTTIGQMASFQPEETSETTLLY